MSSLSHTRAGITDAMITCDAVDILCDRLYSNNDQIRFASAVTLGYLSFNRTASRMLLHNCRNVPHLFQTLMSIIRPETKISKQFVESFQTAKELGLPKLLVKNKIKFFKSNIVNREDTFKGFYNPASLLSNKTFNQILPNREPKLEARTVQKKLVKKMNRSQSAPIKQVVAIEDFESEAQDTVDLTIKFSKPKLGARPATLLNMKI